VAKRFQKIARAGRTAYAVADFPRDLLIRLVECPDLPLRSGPAETIKAGNSALVVRAMLPMHGAMTPVAYKRVLRKSALKQATQAMGRNRTLRTFFAGHRLLQRGVSTARPLVVIVPSRFDLAAPTWIATEWIAGENVATWSQRASRSDNAAAIALGNLLGRMHAAGVAHRDLKSQNLMLSGTTSGQLAASVIDLDGAALLGAALRFRRWKDLARLAADAASWRNVRRSTLLRFVKAYIAAAGIEIDRKLAWRRIAAHVLARQSRRAA
jgi:tRNA A-37 threonylcarbamoyl transferase component Bud32